MIKEDVRDQVMGILKGCCSLNGPWEADKRYFNRVHFSSGCVRVMIRSDRGTENNLTPVSPHWISTVSVTCWGDGLLGRSRPLFGSRHCFDWWTADTAAVEGLSSLSSFAKLRHSAARYATEMGRCADMMSMASGPALR